MTMDKKEICNGAGSAAAILMALMAGVALQAIPNGALAQEIEEITVTARRVEEKLKEVPLAITAFDEKAIEAAGITNLSDVAALTPGLSFFNAFGEALPVPIIRGIVPQDIFGQNAAAIFVDGVYVSGREGLNFSQLDIERIEVLKGPQSAMYGRNAFSGAINYVTKKPSDVFEAKGSVGLGNYGRQKVIGSISGPIFSESFTGRMSALYEDWDGSYDNTLGSTDIGGYRYRSFQGRLRWVAADNLEFNLGAYYSKDHIDDPATSSIPVNCEDRVEQTKDNQLTRPYPRFQTWCGKIPDLAALPDSLDREALINQQFVTLPGSVTGDSMPAEDQAVGEARNLTRANFSIAWEPGDWGSFASLTGYSNLKNSSVFDFERGAGNTVPMVYCPNIGTTGNSGLPQCLNLDGSGGADNYYTQLWPMGFINYNRGSTTEEWSQEIRFTSPQDQRLRWTAGAYYFDSNEVGYQGGLITTTPLPSVSDPDIPAYLQFGLGPIPSTTNLAIGSFIFGPGITPDGARDPLDRKRSEEDIKSWSVFGGGDFKITEEWELHGELRLTQQYQEQFAYSYKRCAQSFNPDPNSEFNGQIPPIYRTNQFPFNTPPSDLCGDDYFDLRTAYDPSTTPYDNGPYTTGPCEPLLDEIGQELNNGVCVPGAFTGSTRFETVTGRLGIKWMFNPDWMVYASVAYGEKPGGIQLLRPSVFTANRSVIPEPISHTFDPEKITAYEVGIKGTTADRRISIDLAAFYNDWTDIVLRQLTELSPKSGLTYTSLVGFNINSGDAGVWGWEATTDLAITENLTGRLTAAWTDSTIKNARQDTFALFPSFYTDEPSCAPEAIAGLPDPTPFIDDAPGQPGTGYPNKEGNEAQTNKAKQCQAISGDVSGNTQMRQPEWTASASLTYDHSLAGEWNWSARADANYVGKIFLGNDNLGWMPAYYNVNFRMGVSSPRYSVDFWVRNLLENNNPTAAFRDIYWSNNSNLTGMESGDPAQFSNFDDFPPLRLSVSYPSLRTYGLEAKMRFGGAER